MSQQKIVHSYYLVLQSTYDLIEIGLGVDHTLLDQLSLNKMDANRDLILEINKLLLKHDLNLTQLSFIGTNLGPAPFTSLRVVIATVNGLAFATGIPLIGVNGLQAFVTEFGTSNLVGTEFKSREANKSPARPERNEVKSRDSAKKNLLDYAITLALLNAYNQDVYYGILDQAGNFTASWGAINELLISLANRFKQIGVQKINLIGNGVNLFIDQIKQDLSDFDLASLDLEISEAVTKSLIPQYCSLAQIAQLAYQAWLTQSVFSAQLQPLYLKTVQTVVNKNYVK